MDEVSFAVVGSGFMGGVLARVGFELPYARCVAAMDVDRVKAEKLVELFGGRAYEDIGDMLQQENPDAVIVATPESKHREAVLAAAQKGCHVLVEKPFATSLDDADAMIQACAENGVVLMVGHILARS